MTEPDGHPGAAIDVTAALAETLEYLAVRPSGHHETVWVGEAPDWFGEYLFGGFVIAQAIIAATRASPDGRRLHSLHAYFLRPVSSVSEIFYDVRTIREGRTFTTCHVGASQNDKPAFDMSCSFTTDTDGYVYDLPGRRDVPAPDDLVLEAGPGPWVAGHLGPTPPAADGTRESTHRMWFRIPAVLGDDVHLHTALLGFATDWTGIGGRPRLLEGDTTGMVSVDHAVWFHRLARADDWLYYDVHSLVNAGGRGLLRGVMRDHDGHVMVSVAQEMRLTPIEATGSGRATRS
jgi:acyl-CoA thioesterase-2